MKDFPSLVRLLEQHPEWRAELRRLLLSEDLLALPEVVRALGDRVAELAAAQRRTEQQVEALTAAQRRTEERLASLAGRVEELAAAQRRTEDELRRLAREVGDLKGSDLERSCREKAASFFQPILRRIRLMDHQELGQILDDADDAVDGGRISLQEKGDVMHADVVVSGQRDGHRVDLLAEVSGVVDLTDVERAGRRARLLEKATGVPTLAAVAGQRILAEAEAEAKASGIWCVLDGVATPPSRPTGS